MDARDLSMSILDQLKAINNDAGKFAAGILSDDISKEDQLDFALRLVDLAVAIKRRSKDTAGLVVEGGVGDDRDAHREPSTSAS